MKDINFISTDLAGLSEALMQAREDLLQIEEQRDTNQRKLDRFDRGITAYMWELERFPHKHRLEISARDVQQMFDALLLYQETGKRVGMLDKALKELT